MEIQKLTVSNCIFLTVFLTSCSISRFKTFDIVQNGKSDIWTSSYDSIVLSGSEFGGTFNLTENGVEQGVWIYFKPSQIQCLRNGFNDLKNLEVPYAEVSEFGKYKNGKKNGAWYYVSDYQLDSIVIYKSDLKKITIAPGELKENNKPKRYWRYIFLDGLPIINENQMVQFAKSKNSKELSKLYRYCSNDTIPHTSIIRYRYARE